MVLAAVALAVLQPAAAAREESPRPADAPPYQQAPHPLDPALKMAEDSLRQIRENIRDYTAVLVKRARINSQLQERQFLFVKIRHRQTDNSGQVATPMSVYMKLLAPSSVKGREVIWVEGRNDGKLIAHDAGIKNLLRVHLDPAGFLAMLGERYPITEIGFENLARKMIETGNRDRKYGECEVRRYRNAKVGSDVCTMFEAVHPVKRPYFDFHCARVYFDNERNILLRYESWSWPTEPGGAPALEEEFTYTNVRLNVGLTDKDFDPDNPEYDFP
jgi:hypothetical protein